MGNPWFWGHPSLRNTKFATQRHAKSSSQCPLCYPWPGQPSLIEAWWMYEVHIIWRWCHLPWCSGWKIIQLLRHFSNASHGKNTHTHTGGDVRSVQHTSQTLVTAWWWLEPWNFNEFHILWRIIPTDELIFFRGVETTNQNMFGFLVRNGCGQPLAVRSFKVTVGCLGMRANRKVLPSRCH